MTDSRLECAARQCKLLHALFSISTVLFFLKKNHIVRLGLLVVLALRCWLRLLRLPAPEAEACPHKVKLSLAKRCGNTSTQSQVGILIIICLPLEWKNVMECFYILLLLVYAGIYYSTIVGQKETSKGKGSRDAMDRWIGVHSGPCFGGRGTESKNHCLQLSTLARTQD